MIDLHCHTTASDGLLTPANMIRQAVRGGVSVIAIADHDTVNGLNEAVQVAEQEGICLIPAIELSAAFPSGDCHLLGYGIQYENENFKEKLAQLKSLREERILRIIERLNLVGVSLSPGDVQNESSGAAPGKPHVARALVKKGYAADLHAALKTYLNQGAPGYVPKDKMSPESALKLIRSVGGIPVLAHPKSLRCKDPEEYDQVIQMFAGQGVAGIEVYATLHHNQDVKLFKKIAERHDLLMTGGSDFHGDHDGRLGYYGCRRRVPESCSQALLQYAHSQNLLIASCNSRYSALNPRPAPVTR